MDVRAILIAGASPYREEERFAGHVLSQLDVLGSPVIARTAARLQQFGIEGISILAAPDAALPFAQKRAGPQVRWLAVEEQEVWRLCEQIFSELAHEGAELVILQRVGPYLELDYEKLVQFHLDRNARVTQVAERDSGVPQPAFVLSASRRNDAAFLFRHQLQNCRSEAANFPFEGYSNALRCAEDLRQIARDALFRQNQIVPAGTEVRPGIWTDKHARIERGARLVAPCYIGEGAVVRTASVVTRASALERWAEADCGSILEDATLLPFCKLGAGLDCSHAVAGYHRMASITRGAEAEIGDARLLTQNSPAHLRNLAFSAAAFASLMIRPFSFRLGRSGTSVVEPQPSAVSLELQDSARALRAGAREQHVNAPSYQKTNAVLNSQ